MKVALTALLVLGWGAAQAARAPIPQILIVQDIVKHEKDKDPNVPLANELASELDKEGRVAPVVWSLTDPFFRAAVNDGLIKGPAESPNLDEALAGAGKIKAEYLMIITAVREGGNLKAKAKLYRRGKVVWNDPSAESQQAMEKVANLEERLRRQGRIEGDQRKPDAEWRVISVTLDNEVDLDNAAVSLARTWAQIMSSGPFKGLPPRPMNPTPEPDPGQAPPVVEVPPPDKVDNVKLVENVQRMLAAGDLNTALLTLRDAVDQEPMDIERRRLLVSVLMNMGMLRLAAEEARRASAIKPDEIELRVMAARAWLRLGDPDEANKDLNEAVARDPNSALTRMLLGEMSLMKLEVAAAVEHFNASVEKQPTAEALFYRGAALLVSGDVQGGKRDTDKAAELGLPKDPGSLANRYLSMASICDAGAIKLGARVRDAFQRARRNRTDAKIGPEVGELANVGAGFRALAELVPAPDRHKESCDRRLLALNLLNQCIAELRDYLQSGDENALGDSTLNLGEALKQLGVVRELQKSEVELGN